ncbi:universal stress protein [Streptomyces sp. NRRL F-5630]|uniref:universal stress protein n=1 Tax=unclassified Streptomyces TaxID=2593676 RepID=UPI0004C842C0|nr:universal stress protein [Streptomyces sp. NRRL F-5630]
MTTKEFTAEVLVGLDGSDGSRQAMRWGADEAALRHTRLHLVHVQEWPATWSAPLPHDPQLDVWAQSLVREQATRVREDHPGLNVRTTVLSGTFTATELGEAAATAGLVALGSSEVGRGGHGFAVGSVSLAVAGTAPRPVVLVRPGAPADGVGQEISLATQDAATPPAGQTATGNITVGLDPRDPCQALLAFAFEEAALHRARLRFVHGWKPFPSYGYGGAVHGGIDEETQTRARTEINGLLAPWRRQYPEVETDVSIAKGSPANSLMDASLDARLVVVGRRSRAVPVGTRLGHVAHAVVHHSPAPVAVVPLA